MNLDLLFEIAKERIHNLSEQEIFEIDAALKEVNSKDSLFQEIYNYDIYSSNLIDETNLFLNDYKLMSFHEEEDVFKIFKEYSSYINYEQKQSEVEYDIGINEAPSLSNSQTIAA